MAGWRSVSDAPRLDRLDPTGRFSNRAADYARHRPSYPDAAIDAVLSGLGAPPELVAADVGAGTGISARALAARGVRVIAIEPNAAMRAKAEPHPRVEWRDATGERTGLPPGSVDLVTCAQAFHWLDPDLAYAEFRRILRPAGRVALVWNETRTDDPFTAGYRSIVRAASDDDLKSIQSLRADFGIESRLFVRPRTLRFPYEQVLDEDGFVGRATSASYVPASGPVRDRMVEDLRALHRRFADSSGRCRLLYETRVHIAEAASSL
jgi:SAM-dependent methyltransferase